MSKYVCDCGAVYSDLNGIEACQNGNHGNPIIDDIPFDPPVLMASEATLRVI